MLVLGAKWRAHRKLIAPTFHLNILKGFVDLFNANSKVTVERLRKECGKTFDCHDHMLESTVDILLGTYHTYFRDVYFLFIHMVSCQYFIPNP